MVFLLKRGFVVGKGGIIQLIVILVFNFQIFLLKEGK